MADEDILQAFLSGGGGSTKSPYADLGQFENTLSANNIYSQIAAPIVGAKFNTATWSPSQIGLTAAGQAFLGTVLGKLAEADKANQLSKAANSLNALYADPLNTATPDGVDPQAYNELRLSAVQANRLKQEKKTEEDDALKRQLKLNILARRPDLMPADMQSELGIGGGASDAWGKAMQLAGGDETLARELYRQASPTLRTSPDSPLEKYIADQRQKFNESKAVADYSYIRDKAESLIELAAQNDAAMDPAITKLAVQLIEAGLSVNNGESAAVANSTSIPDAWKGQIYKALKGGSGMDATVRNGLIQLAKTRYNITARRYGDVLGKLKEDAQLHGYDVGRVATFGSPESFEAIYQRALSNAAESKANPLTVTGTTKSSVPSGLDLQAVKKRRDELQAKGFPAQKIASMLRQEFGK